MFGHLDYKRGQEIFEKNSLKVAIFDVK